MENSIYSVDSCGRAIGRSTQYVRALIRTGWLKAESLGRFYIISEAEVQRLKKEMPTLTRSDYAKPSTRDQIT